MKIAICDDEMRILEEVTSCIKEYCNQSPKAKLEVFPFGSATALNSAIEDGQNFDIFLLDVYIGDEMGTELARQIRIKGIENPVIFLTTSIDFAPESYESGTLR